MNKNLEKKNYNKTTIKAQIKCQKKKKEKAQYKINLISDYAFGYQLKNQLILLFNLFLLIFMGPTVLFDIIYDVTGSTIGQIFVRPKNQ